MSNFKSLTQKKKDYSIAELMDYKGSDTQKTANTSQTANTTGTFTPSNSATGGSRMSIKDVLSGIDLGLEEIAPSLPGITTLGSAIKSHYNSKGYAEDEAAAQAKLDALEASKPTYLESDELKGAKGDLADIEGAWNEKYPDGYQMKYGDRISELISKLGETEKFNYDVESDPLWNSIKDQYQRNALLGKQNAIGDAAGLTGGYGSSYAIAAGQQAYQQSISEMTDLIPELHNTALNAWQANRGALTDNLYAVMNAEDMEYSKWMDEYNMWANNRDYMAQKVANMSEEEFNHYLADLSSWQTDRAYYSGEKQQAIANQQWQASFDENRRQFNQQMAFNYINMGVGAAVDLTTAGISAGVQLAGIGADTALGAAGLALEQKQFDASLAYDTAMSQQDYEIALKELAEEQRQFDIKNGVDTQSISTQPVGGSRVTGSGVIDEDNGGTGPVNGDNVEKYNELIAGLEYQNKYSNTQLSRANKEGLIEYYYANEYITEETANKLIKEWLK